MKKYILFAVAAVALTAACSKQPVSTGSASSQSGFELESAVPVRFASNVGRVATKGIGALDAWVSSQDLYFFGIERLKDQTGADSLNLADPFIYNVSSHPADTITLFNPAIGTGHEEPYYYGDGNYEFYGYFLDDAGIEGPDGERITKTDDAYVAHIEINGTQDVLVGYADRDMVVLHKGKLDPPVAVNKDRLFSAYGIRKWDAKPEMLFRHKLSRFDFRVRSGEAAAAGKVKVTGISVVSNTTADVVVAGNGIYEGLNNVSTPDTLLLQVKVIDDAGTGAYHLDTLKNITGGGILAPEYAGLDKNIDGSILVIPGDAKYALRMELEQPGVVEPVTKTQWLNIDFTTLASGEQMAKPGYKYNVTLVVYETKPVEIVIALAPWEEGDSFVLDPDAD